MPLKPRDPTEEKKKESFLKPNSYFTVKHNLLQIWIYTQMYSGKHCEFICNLKLFAWFMNSFEFITERTLFDGNLAAKGPEKSDCEQCERFPCEI